MAPVLATVPLQFLGLGIAVIGLLLLVLAVVVVFSMVEIVNAYEKRALTISTD